MSFSTRTEAEKSRAKQLSGSLVRPVRAEYTCASKNLTKLDLSCLPIETNFKLALLEMEPGAAPSIQEDTGAVLMELGLRTVDGTLRQAKWGRDGHGMRSQWGLVQLGYVTPSGIKRFINLRMDGTNSSLHTAYTMAGARHTIDVASFKSMATRERLYRAFVPQHLLRFPATYHGRDNVSFLGLPQGTIVPLKNGGEFMVNCRTNVTVEEDGSASGHLHLIAMDDKAKRLAESMGWGASSLLGKEGYLVHPNLYTGKSSGRNFDTANIRCPYADPTEDYRDIFPSPLEHEVDMTKGLVPVSPSRKATWAATPEELAESLDDFLFG